MIPRATWNYHYIPALLFGIMLAGVIFQIVMDTLEEYNYFAFVITKFCLLALLVTSTCYYLYLSPWTYAIPMSEVEHEQRFLFNSWHL